jgi:hypothetical protein
VVRVNRTGVTRIVAILVIACAAFAASVGATAATAKTARHTNPSCAQLLSAAKLDQAYYGDAQPTVGRYSGVRASKSRAWYYPYNKPQSQTGSFCFYTWTLAQTPADYQGLFAPAGPTVPGADMAVGFDLSLKSFNAGRAQAQQNGTGEPGDFNPGHVRKISFGRSAKAAYLLDSYSGTGPTYNNLGVCVLTKHNDYFAIYAWDATLPQLENIAKTVLKADS